MTTTSISKLSTSETVLPEDLLLISRKSSTGTYLSYAAKASGIAFGQQPLDELRAYQAAVLEKLTYIATQQQPLSDVQAYQTDVLKWLAHISWQISCLSGIAPAPTPEAIAITYNSNYPSDPDPDPEPELTAITLTYDSNYPSDSDPDPDPDPDDKDGIVESVPSTTTINTSDIQAFNDGYSLKWQ